MCVRARRHREEVGDVRAQKRIGRANGEEEKHVREGKRSGVSGREAAAEMTTRWKKRSVREEKLAGAKRRR